MSQYVPLISLSVVALESHAIAHGASVVALESHAIARGGSVVALESHAIARGGSVVALLASGVISKINNINHLIRNQTIKFDNNVKMAHCGNNSRWQWLKMRANNSKLICASVVALESHAIAHGGSAVALESHAIAHGGSVVALEFHAIEHDGSVVEHKNHKQGT